MGHDPVSRYLSYRWIQILYGYMYKSRGMFGVFNAMSRVCSKGRKFLVSNKGIFLVHIFFV